ncbi:MAG: hypothetical protein EAZ84_09820 [Verrucomicrobia bacterium]|nr:MAG: hypothetical protein EAZ84_09820 [Verrucomicrobiota bacterium]
MKAQISVPLFAEELQTLVAILDAEIVAHKNWIVSRVENDDIDGAKELSKKLRHIEEIRYSFRSPLRVLERASEN